ncbi:uridine kinase [Chryseobacterium taichungense]|uniref:Uridine kinase n=1 Tax=Chryseobacterium taichungense TaxID=295069 RepID=A0A1H8CIQ4_9FLAO|nr:hypothetical protein [Chryseobacterium taichungense]SEM94304.1 uridine kinase [Chryseobacterium taichungense]
MIGDIIELKENHLAIGKEIFEILNTKLPLKSKHKFTIGIAGESGSGKSVTAFALQKILNKNDIKSMVWQMDDYFKIPPKSNHENRLKSIENVGMQEVDLVKLSENISEFKNGKTIIEKPLVHYKENRIANEKIDAADYKVLIVEGTYILEIDDFDFKIFIDRNYKDTYENRMSRNRDEKSDFVERVLEIEHQIIKQFKAKADLVLGKNYELLLK